VNQSWDPKLYSRDAAFVSNYGTELLSMLGPAEGRSLLDLGCGEGALTAKLLSLGWNVTGVDSSEEQVRAALTRGISAEVMDGEGLEFNKPFDCVISNAALHWMKNPEKVLDGVWNALKAGGIFVGEMGAYGNVESVVQTASNILMEKGFDPKEFNPWYFPTENEYSELLIARGFMIESIQTFTRPTELPGDILDWLAIFAQSFTSPLKSSDKKIFYCEMRERLKSQLLSDEEKWIVDYVRLRFKVLRFV